MVTLAAWWQRAGGGIGIFLFCWHEFGVDTSQGRSIKNGVIGILAAGAFNPRESVKLQGETISLAQYAARMNIQLLRAADLTKCSTRKELTRT